MLARRLASLSPPSLRIAMGDQCSAPMRNVLLALVIPLLAIATTGCQMRGQKKTPPPPPVTKDYNKPLGAGERALVDIDINELPVLTLASEDRARLQTAIQHSLAFLNRPSADLKYPMGSITKDQVVRSLHAVAELLQSTTDAAQFDAALKSRFRALMSVGCDDRGTVLFTGYYTPIFNASRVPTATYKYPIYKRPADLVQGAKQDDLALQRLPDGSSRPYPARAELESNGSLRGLELIYFQDPYEAYVVEVQGSAKVLLPDGTQLEIGYSGTNGHKYHPIAMDLVNEGKIRREELSLAVVRAYFRDHPAELVEYRQRNPRMIFFAPTKGGPFGSLGQPVTTDVSVATDKSIFPAGALCLAATNATAGSGRGGNYAALRLDQDTGGGIRAAGRCDLYMGEGDAAERRAGNQFAEGKLYYLLLKE
jgi:membrane-bound lytic murein transglycosylase A